MRDLDALLDLENAEEYKNEIERLYAKSNSWDRAKYANRGEKFYEWFEDRRKHEYWDITEEEWFVLVEGIKEINQGCKDASITLTPSKEITVPKKQTSAWRAYLKTLDDKGYTKKSILELEESCKNLGSKLRNETKSDNPNIGMVVGNVQSGKTSNMAGLIALAYDLGYNFVIVLSGLIENLRQQTESRIYNDLRRNTNDYNITLLSNLEVKSSMTTAIDSLSNLDLKDNSTTKYITFTLKNDKRLEKLLTWLNSDKNAKSKLKILLIDDEADQASINVKDINKDYSVIFNYIKKIVYSRDKNNKETSNYGCMNYFGYTATPYGNLLNESGQDTLYPKDFISILKTPSEYIGAEKIFGIDGLNLGLDFVNIIDSNEIDEFKSISFAEGRIPQSYKDSIFWFIITIAYFRYYKIEEPVTMLIHSDIKMKIHDTIAEETEKYLNSLKYENCKDMIRKVYDNEVGRVTAEDFRKIMTDYNPKIDIKSIPSYEEIEALIKEILDYGISNIKFNSDERKEYCKGINLCIDNSAKTVNINDYTRLIYPDKTDEINKISPAFIVVGGQTLSRGLTLKQLTTSYFLRTTHQADTLMQMARWFGYRIGYELIERIWMPLAIKKQFKSLTKLEYLLRNEIYSMNQRNLTPESYFPRIMAFERSCNLTVTAKNKQQSALKSNKVFYDISAQTTWFSKNDDIIQENFDKTVEFIESLGPITKEANERLGNKYIHEYTAMWQNVDYEKTINYISSLNIPQQSATINYPKEYLEWYKKEYSKGNLGNWTIICGSLKPETNSQYEMLKLSNCELQLERRTQYIFKNKVQTIDTTDIIDLNTISQSEDRLMDIDFVNQKIDDDFDKIDFKQKRTKYASKTNPLLIIYIVDKNSGKELTIPQETNKYTRYPLNLKQHLVGYYIYVPGVENSVDLANYISQTSKNYNEEE